MILVDLGLLPIILRLAFGQIKCIRLLRLAAKNIIRQMVCVGKILKAYIKNSLQTTEFGSVQMAILCQEERLFLASMKV